MGFERQGKFTKCVSRRLHHVSRGRILDMSHNMPMSVRNSGFETQNTPKVCSIVKVQIVLPLTLFVLGRSSVYVLILQQPHTTVLYRVIPASNPLSLRRCNVSCVKRSTQVHIHMKRYTTTLVLLRSHS